MEYSMLAERLLKWPSEYMGQSEGGISSKEEPKNIRVEDKFQKEI